MFTICAHGLRLLSTVTVCAHDLRSRSTLTIYGHGLRLLSTVTVCAQDLRSRSALTIYNHDLRSRSAVTIYCPSLRSGSTLTVCTRDLPSRSALTIYGHGLQSLSTVTVCSHDLRSRSTLTIYGHGLTFPFWQTAWKLIHTWNTAAQFLVCMIINLHAEGHYSMHQWQHVLLQYHTSVPWVSPLHSDTHRAAANSRRKFALVFTEKMWKLALILAQVIYKIPYIGNINDWTSICIHVTSNGAGQLTYSMTGC